MSIRYLVLTLALALAVIARAAELDHLVPVDPHPPDWEIRYSDQLRSRFTLDASFFAQMLVRPSFSGEYVVRLHGAKDDSHFEFTDKFFLTYSAAHKSIWISMPENNGTKEQKEVNVATTTVEVPKPLATRIRQLWQRMLLRTRYPKDGGTGADGTTTEFGFEGSVYGETWSPHERKSPLLFIELGQSLIAYCRATPDERPAAAKRIESKATQLEKYLSEHPSK